MIWEQGGGGVEVGAGEGVLRPRATNETKRSTGLAVALAFLIGELWPAFAKVGGGAASTQSATLQWPARCVVRD